MRTISSLTAISGGRTRYDLLIEIDAKTTDNEIKFFCMIFCNKATNNKFSKRVETLQELRELAISTGEIQYYSENRNLKID